MKIKNIIKVIKYEQVKRSSLSDKFSSNNFQIFRD